MINQRLLQIFSGLPCSPCSVSISKPASAFLLWILLLANIPAENDFKVHDPNNDPNAKITFEAGRSTFAPGEFVKIRYQGETIDNGFDWIEIRTRGHAYNNVLLKKILPKNAKVNGVIKFLPNAPGLYSVHWGAHEFSSPGKYLLGRGSVAFSVDAGFTSKKTGATVKEAQDLLDDIATIQAIAPRINAVLTAYNKASASTEDQLTVDGLRTVMPRYRKVEADFRELAGHLEKTAATGKVVELATGIRKVAAEFLSLADGIKELARNAKLGDLSQAEHTGKKMIASTKSLTETIRTFVKKRAEAKLLVKYLALQQEVKSRGKVKVPEWVRRGSQPDVSSSKSDP